MVTEEFSLSIELISGEIFLSNPKNNQQLIHFVVRNAVSVMHSL